MKIQALHGFLGQGTDWNPLMDLLPPTIDWIMPRLFAPTSEIRLSSYDEFSEDISLLKIDGPKILVGYSMGGRLAYELFKRNPEEWDALVVISAHPGLEHSEEAAARVKQAMLWKERFQSWEWSELLSAWNSQPVLKNSKPLVLSEEGFDRQKLCQALENLSVDGQSLDPMILKKNRSKIWAYVGEKDRKYTEIYSRMENRGIIENLTVFQGLGHRILHDGVEQLATQLEAQLEL
jgi:2-succinyl-6-hydroxy-2,4-cyclohexadiene-1-carboxylate synthase